MGERSASLIYVRPIVCPVSAVFGFKKCCGFKPFSGAHRKRVVPRVILWDFAPLSCRKARARGLFAFLKEF